jgi:hypothetical protein
MVDSTETVRRAAEAMRAFGDALAAADIAGAERQLLKEVHNALDLRDGGRAMRAAVETWGQDLVQWALDVRWDAG